jgi:hypothetical protein
MAGEELQTPSNEKEVASSDSTVYETPTFLDEGTPLKMSAEAKTMTKKAKEANAIRKAEVLTIIYGSKKIK